MAHYVLDVNETLSDLSPLGEVLSSYGAPAELARTWFAGLLRDGFALSLQRRAPAFLDLARDELRVALHGVERLEGDVETVVEDVLAAMGDLDVHPDVVPGVRALTDAGHAVSTLSNGSVRSTEGLLERAGIRDEVTAVLSVEVGPVWKPHPDAYAIAVRELQTLAAELTMVAVHPWDLDGAAAAGLQTVWIDRQGTPWPASFAEPGLTVRALTELAERAGHVNP
ncbi:haloacid dehalogenase type II [Nocardioides flavescens]|uniref:Haloacid dehalogenase type II n=1 Tax=Nocardioides flavescens TaxID=2691959 RepID=A0A6L7EPN8_9ACTN|nr:haloacid dehalogenase type II [Nocardioides flavescens]